MGKTQKIGNATIMNIDCMEYMKTLPDKYFDLALTDPPYNVGRKYNKHNDNMVDYKLWCKDWFDELKRVSNTIVMTVGTKNLKQWILETPKHVVIWHKPAQCSPSPLGGFNAYEPILVWGKNHKRIGHDIFTTNGGLQADAAWHNCPKHLPSWEKILNMFINSPARVFDPFMGSGTGAIACNNLGFEFFGCELDEDYYNAACERIAQHARQQRLFA